ncbi:hypothetical protein GCM10010207_63680 [Streptomyces atratus]|nr:hypothetical protein GCM10010207_63680 [Streptomyces atratus]
MGSDSRSQLAAGVSYRSVGSADFFEYAEPFGSFDSSEVLAADAVPERAGIPSARTLVAPITVFTVVRRVIPDVMRPTVEVR